MKSHRGLCLQKLSSSDKLPQLRRPHYQTLPEGLAYRHLRQSHHPHRQKKSSVSVTSTTDTRLLTGADETSDSAVCLIGIDWAAASRIFSVGFEARPDRQDPATTVAGATLLTNASSFPWENDNIKGQEVEAVKTAAMGTSSSTSLKNLISAASLRVPSGRRAQAESDMAKGNERMTLQRIQCSFYKQLILWGPQVSCQFFHCEGTEKFSERSQVLNWMI